MQRPFRTEGGHCGFDFVRALQRRRLVLLAPLVPLGCVLTYQLDLVYGTLRDRVRGETAPSVLPPQGSGECPMDSVVNRLILCSVIVKAVHQLCVHLTEVPLQALQSPKRNGCVHLDVHWIDQSA